MLIINVHVDLFRPTLAIPSMIVTDNICHDLQQQLFFNVLSFALKVYSTILPTSGLDLAPYVQNPYDPVPIYDLFATTNHFGGLAGGHC